MYRRIDEKTLLLLCALSWFLGVLSAPLIKAVVNTVRGAFMKLINRGITMPITHKTAEQTSSEDDTDTEEPEMKLVLCVRTDLEMGKGKIAAQCGHAALGAYTDSIYRKNPYLDEWMRNGQRKVVLKVKSHDDMMALRRAAIAANVNHHTTCDAGRTQIPAGSYTVIAIGPAPENKIDAITGHLKLL